MVVCGQQYKAKIENLLRKKAALKRIRQYAGVVSWFIARADKVREDVTPLYSSVTNRALDLRLAICRNHKIWYSEQTK